MLRCQYASLNSPTKYNYISLYTFDILVYAILYLSVFKLDDILFNAYNYWQAFYNGYLI